MQIFLNYRQESQKITSYSLDNFVSVSQLHSHILATHSYNENSIQILLEGIPLSFHPDLQLEDLNLKTLTISNEVIGGKGGFGSL